MPAGQSADWHLLAKPHHSELKSAGWTGLGSARAATRQIPIADIAMLELGVTNDVAVEGCVPGFYYTMYSGMAMTNMKLSASEKRRNILCKPGEPVKFSDVVKPSDSSGFFTIGVLEAPIAYTPGADHTVTGYFPIIPGHPPRW